MKDPSMYFIMQYVLGYYHLVITGLWLSTNYYGIILMSSFDLLQFSMVTIQHLLKKKRRKKTCVQCIKKHFEVFLNASNYFIGLKSM